MSEATIPRLKSRRKRRRPLSPQGRMALLQICVALVSLTCCFIGMVDKSSAVWHAVCVVTACVDALFIRYSWPTLLREIRRMDD